MTKPLYIVAVDGSDWSKRAAQKAVTLAKDTQAKIIFMTVINWSGFRPLSPEHALHRREEKEEEEKIAMEIILEPLQQEYADSGVHIETFHTWGDPREELHRLVKKRHADMIFLGRRGRSTIKDLVMGSVSNAIAHTTGVPILLVP